MYTDMNGLGKSKFFKKIKKALFKHPLAPLPIKAMQLKKTLKPKPSPVAPAVSEPITTSPVTDISTVYGPETGIYPQPPQYYVPKPLPVQPPQFGPGFFEKMRRYQEIYQPKPPMQFYPQPVQQPQFYPQPIQQPVYAEPSQPSPAILPGDYFPTELEYGGDYGNDIDNAPMITSYESAAMSQFGTDEEFMDTPAAYESEAGYLQGLGQESGSTGGWFQDLISTGTKAAIEIQRAKAAAKAAKSAAPIVQPRTTYMPAFGGGFNLNTALMIGGLGLAGLLIFQGLRKRGKR
jgi:hypothetical protein